MMASLRHILFPYDFSAQCHQAVPFVRALARSFDARVTVLGVVPPSFESLPAGMGSDIRVDDDAAKWSRALQSRLDQALVEEFAGLRVERVAEGGDPALRIVDFAHSHNVDLVMMPTHGLGVFRSFLAGSVTAKVLHDAACPVWTAAHADTQVAPERPRTILCAVDRSAQAPALMRWAAAFSAGVGARLSLLHIVPPISDWLSLESEQRLQDQVREKARATMVSLATSAGVDAPLHVAVGEIVPTAAEHAREGQADLLIIGRGSVSEPFGRLRTHVFGIIQRSPCPVLSV